MPDSNPLLAVEGSSATNLVEKKNFCMTWAVADTKNYSAKAAHRQTECSVMKML